MKLLFTHPSDKRFLKKIKPSVPFLKEPILVSDIPHETIIINGLQLFLINNSPIVTSQSNIKDNKGQFNQKHNDSVISNDLNDIKYKTNSINNL